MNDVIEFVTNIVTSSESYDEHPYLVDRLLVFGQGLIPLVILTLKSMNNHSLIDEFMRRTSEI